MDHLFNDLERNIDKYQIDTDKDGTITVKIGTSYNRNPFKSASIHPGAKNSKPGVSGTVVIEDEEEESVKEVFGQKYNFQITTDKSKKSGLAGIPSNVENWLLETFSKEEIMADPQHVI